MKQFKIKILIKGIVAVSLFLLVSIPLPAQWSNELSEYEIPITPDESRAYLFSNQQDSYWFGESNRYHDDPEYGWNFRHQQILQDVVVAVNGTPLSRETAQSIVSPMALIRKYRDIAITEKLYFLQNQHVLVIEVVPDSVQTISLVPVLSSGTAQIETQGNVATVTQQKYVTASGLPVRLFMESNVSGTWSISDSSEQSISMFSSDNTPLRWDGTISDTCRFYITLSDDADDHQELVSSWEADFENQVRQLSDMTNLIRTNEPSTNKALVWAQFQLQNLLTTMHGNFLLPELPEGDWYQSREALLSIPGLLIAREFSTVRSILQTLIDEQITDQNSSDYGLIPDRILPGYRTHEATDVTPLMGIMLYEYLKYSGDFGFAQEMYRAMYHATEGTLQHRTDASGLLIHPDGATWMDARTADGFVTPRGNRAVEVQVFWYRQLQAGIGLATELGYDDTATKWREAARNVRTSFDEFYWNTGNASLYDYINPDKTPDLTIRPNQIFAVSQADNLLSPSRQGMVVDRVVNQLLFPGGIGTLSQFSEDFHTYISVLPYYSINEALHNGTIWPWLSGPVISGLVKVGSIELAYNQSQNMTSELLNGNLVGSLGKFKNVSPNDNAMSSIENFTTSTLLAKSYGPALSEYIRTWYQDYLGIRPDAVENLLVLRPQLPDDITAVSTSALVGNNRLDIEYIKAEEQFTFRLRNTGNPVDIQLQIRTGDSLYALPRTFQLGPTDEPVSIHFDYTANKFAVEETRVNTSVEPDQFNVNLEQAATQVTEFPEMDHPVFQIPDYPLLTGSQITHDYVSARPIVDVKDPSGDHYGPAALYQYPLHPSYEPGMYDLTGFAVRTDDEYYYFDLYFDQLLETGVSVEFGMSDVFTAIGIHTGDSTGANEFGYNSGVETEPASPVQYMLYIGNGIRLVDARNNILLGYIPGRDDYSVLDRDQNRMQIAIPVDQFPQIRRWWTYTIFTGIREDFDGNGIGAFRTVMEGPSLWHGGGKAETDTPNWFDILQVGFEQ